MKIVITDCDHGFFDPEGEVVSEAGGSLAVYQCHTPAEVLAVAQDAEGILCQYVSITEEVLEGLPRLCVVGRYGVGLDNVDLQAASKLGIPVVYAPDFCTEEVADHAMALILALSRQLVPLHLSYTRSDREMGAGLGGSFALLSNVRRIKGQVLGLVGLGRIGTAVAKRAHAFGYRVLVHDRYVPNDTIQALGTEPAALDDLLRASDVVSLHCSLTSETRDLIGARELGLMKATAFLVNTGRGGLVNESALLVSLKEKRLAGAALDVTQLEPLPRGHPLLDMEEVILTPHVAFYSRESIIGLKKDVAQSVIKVLTGVGKFPLANPEVLRQGRAGRTRGS
jgi:D-3-phosphoglycerate dehydrogenase